MSQATAIAALRAKVDYILSRLNKISTAAGKIRQDASGTGVTGVVQTHTHTGTGEGGNLLTEDNWLKVTASAPTVNDDVDLGYQIGSQWIDTAGVDHYVCLDATDGAAVWKQTTP